MLMSKSPVQNVKFIQFEILQNKCEEYSFYVEAKYLHLLQIPKRAITDYLKCPHWNQESMYSQRLSTNLQRTTEKIFHIIENMNFGLIPAQLHYSPYME